MTLAELKEWHDKQAKLYRAKDAAGCYGCVPTKRQWRLRAEFHEMATCLLTELEKPVKAKETPPAGISGIVWDGDTACFGKPWNKGEKPMFRVYKGDERGGVTISWPFNCDELNFDISESRTLLDILRGLLGEPQQPTFPVKLEDDWRLSDSAHLAGRNYNYRGKITKIINGTSYVFTQTHEGFLAGVQWMLDQIHAKK